MPASGVDVKESRPILNVTGAARLMKINQSAHSGLRSGAGLPTDPSPVFGFPAASGRSKPDVASSPLGEGGLNVDKIRSGTAVFRTAPDGRILAWNAAAERLTGIRAGEAHGQRCWQVLAGRDAEGGLVCHPGCSVLRLAHESWPVHPFDLQVRLADGDVRLVLSTIVLDGDQSEPVILHTLNESPTPSRHAAIDAACGNLTPRQCEILHLLAQGIRPRQIAARLKLSETTVRNHIQAILLSLGVHSQLEAVAQVRRLAIADTESAA